MKSRERKKAVNPCNEVSVSEWHDKCKNSGLFKIDEYGNIQAIFKLTPDKKNFSDGKGCRDSKTWDSVPPPYSSPDAELTAEQKKKQKKKMIRQGAWTAEQLQERWTLRVWNEAQAEKGNLPVSDLPERLKVAFAAQKMERELTWAVSNYMCEDGASIERSIILEEQDFFRRHVVSAINEQCFLSLDDVDPQVQRLIKAGEARIERNVKKGDLRIKTSEAGKNFRVRDSERKYNNLIERCLEIFQRYIPLPASRGKLNFHEDYLHYMAHFLIGIEIGIEERPERGHLPVFEKIKMHYYRKNQ